MVYLLEFIIIQGTPGNLYVDLGEIWTFGMEWTLRCHRTFSFIHGIAGGIQLQALWSILQQARKKEISGAPPTFTFDLKLVIIPHFCPLISVFVDRVEEEVM